MEKILVIGNSGSGKTTFSVALAEKLGLPLVHLDKLFWCGNWEHISREEFDRKLALELSRPQWIIDGNFGRTVPVRLQACDTVFFFDLPRLTCLWGATQRVFKNRGKTRPDMGGNCPEHFDKEKLSLYKSIWKFHRDQRPQLLQQLAQATHAKIIVFKNRRQAQKFLENGGE